MSKYKTTTVLTDYEWSCTSIVHTSRNGKWISRFWTISGMFPKYMRILTRHDSAEHIKNAKKGGKYEGAERWIFLNDKRMHFESRKAHEKYMKDNGLSSSWNRIHT